MKTLHRISVEKLQIGDTIIRNGRRYVVDYMEKDPHGFDTYVIDDHHNREYLFISDNELVTIDQ